VPRVAESEMDVRQLRLKPWWRAVTKALALLCVLGAKYLTCQPEELDCEHAVRDANDGLAVIACEREYIRTQDPAIGAKLANSLRRSGKLQAASALANNLIATSARSDALQVLGKIDTTEERLDAGRSKLENARELHVAEGRPAAIAVDDQALSKIFTIQKRFVEALRALDTCITESREANDRILEGYCHLSAGQVLGEVGYFEGAQQELARAEPLLVMNRDLAQLAIVRSALDQHYGFGPLEHSNNAQAVLELEHAIVHATAAALTEIKRRAELNLVYSLAELGRTAEAAAHLEVARLLDIDGTDEVDRALLAARIAYRRGDLASATSIHARTYAQLTDDDDRLRVCVLQAQIGLATGDLASATMWARRGVEVVEAMRGAQSVIELRPWMLSMRRQPHELLFTALARAHQLDDALAVFDRWQGRTLLDAMALDKSASPATLRAAAMHTEALHRLLPVLSSAPIMKTVDRDTLARALRDVELVAVLVANDEVWRITARHGQLDMVDVGALAALQPALDQFEATPTVSELAEPLGARLLGDATFRDTDETLFVLLDGPLASLPIAALRARGHLLVAMRPIVRAPRLSELGCVPARSGARHAVVVADARGNLPDARRGAGETAARFGVTPAVGATATRAALFSASRDDVLDVAVHASVDLGGGSLDLYDQPVSALEISGRGGGPALVVLSACASAASDDGELAMSLATAFLASGSPQVIGTLHSVTDPGAREVTSAFYRARGVEDPARALAHVQAELSGTSNLDWPYFVLFGHDTCRRETP
jgi:tetratricopeptide (TPR) repeat protein